MRLYTAIPFLPSPAVPYVRFSLLIVTRWKPLPPRHYCDTQAHHYTLVAPVPRGPWLRGVMLSTSIIANPASSASLMDSFRLHLIRAYTKSLCHSRIDPDCTSDLPQFTLHFLFLHAAIHTPASRSVASVCYFTKRISLHPICRGSALATLPTPSSTGFPEDSFCHEAAMFTLCYGL